MIVPLAPPPPPEPPEDFSGPERAVWHHYVAACPPGWFTPDVHPLLERLCMFVVWARRLDIDLRARDYRFADEEEEHRYLEVHKVLVMLATKLRLTLRSRNDFGPKKAAKRMRSYTAPDVAPWGS